MSSSLINKTSGRKFNFEVREKTDIEKEIELVEMKVNSSKVWTEVAFRQKMKYALITEMMSHHIAKQWDQATTHENLKDINQDFIVMQTFEKILKDWVKTFEERKENWLKHVSDLAIKKAVASSSWEKY